MKIKKSLWVAAFVAVAAMAAAPMVQSTSHAARVPKPSGKVKMKVNGKRFSSFKQATSATSTSLPALFQVIANSKPSRKGVKTLIFSVNVDLATATLPLTMPAFNGVYTETSLTGVSASWAGEGLTVTIDKIKGSFISGKFSGTLPVGDAGSASGPATFEGGTFKVKLLLAPGS